MCKTCYQKELLSLLLVFVTPVVLVANEGDLQFCVYWKLKDVTRKDDLLITLIWTYSEHAVQRSTVFYFGTLRMDICRSHSPNKTWKYGVQWVISIHCYVIWALQCTNYFWKWIWFCKTLHGTPALCTWMALLYVYLVACLRNIYTIWRKIWPIYMMYDWSEDSVHLAFDTEAKLLT